MTVRQFKGLAAAPSGLFVRGDSAMTPKANPYEDPQKAPSGHDTTSTPFSCDRKSLELLFDYTKFHIGVYLTLGSAFLTAVALKDGGENPKLLVPVSLPMVLVALIFIAVAGLAGGIIASSITQTKAGCSAQFLDTRIGPWHFERFLRMRALTWTEIEHTAFWLSLLFAILSFVPGISR